MLLSAWLQEPALVACCDALGRLVDDWRPDVIVGEPLMLPASIVADARQIPLAGCGYPGALLSLDSMPELDRALHHVGALLARVRERAGCKNHAGPQLFCWSDELQLVFFPPEWYATLRAPSSANAQYVGALPWRRTAAGDGDVRPLIVVASSSSYAPDPQILENIFAAVDAAGGRVLTAGHESTRPLFEPLPAHVQWERWIDYEAVLPRARAIIQHGGLGTTHAAARAALPQLVLPGPIDQVLHAEAVARFGAGINYVGPLTPEALVPLVRDLLEAASYATQAATLQERFAACGGVPRAAELLVQHARGRGRNDALDVGRFDASRTA
jgi:UDP:flavonoid glycosyltransferase YjiC (YdhE family)